MCVSACLSSGVQGAGGGRSRGPHSFCRHDWNRAAFVACCVRSLVFCAHARRVDEQDPDRKSGQLSPCVGNSNDDSVKKSRLGFTRPLPSQCGSLSTAVARSPRYYCLLRHLFPPATTAFCAPCLLRDGRALWGMRPSSCTALWAARHPGTSRPYWSWEPANCRLEEITADGFCRAMEGRKGLLLVGGCMQLAVLGY